MSKLYAITNGEYSDYHIVTLTDDRETAEQLVAKYSREGYGNEWRLEEYENATINDVRECYKVSFNRANEIIKVEQVIDADYYQRALNKEVDPKGYGNVTNVYVLANDIQHACKIASDELFRYNCENPERYYEEKE